jgi:hypothetical protein
MSDGALSQDEIDALLAGVDSAGLGSSGPSAMPGNMPGMMPSGGMSFGGGSSEEDRRIFQNFLSSNIGSSRPICL